MNQLVDSNVQTIVSDLDSDTISDSGHLVVGPVNPGLLYTQAASVSGRGT